MKTFRISVFEGLLVVTILSLLFGVTPLLRQFESMGMLAYIVFQPEFDATWRFAARVEVIIKFAALLSIIVLACVAPIAILRYWNRKRIAKKRKEGEVHIPHR